MTRVAWMGWRDDGHPGDEYVELTVDTRFARSGGVDLSGFTLRNNAGDAYAFPAGFTIHGDAPVRIVGGQGTDGETLLHWDIL